jgi:methionyl aminopeptidase
MSQLIKNLEEIKKIRQAGKILSAVLKKLASEAKPGVTLLELDDLARQLIIAAGAQPAFLGYRPDGAKEKFPYTLCTSLNEIIVHGKPSDYRLQPGDLLKLDLGVNYQGGIADAAVSLPIGKVPEKVLHLLKITKNALKEAIRAVKPGHTVGDIGFAVERTATRGNVKVIEGLTGHGVGRALHEDPVIYNYGKPGTGLVLEEGMVLAIEPMTSLTTTQAIQLPDDSFVTADKSVAAHFEHTVLVTAKGAEILTE